MVKVMQMSTEDQTDRGLAHGRQADGSINEQGSNSEQHRLNERKPGRPRKDIKDICVAVAAHKPYRMPTDPMYMPMQVGKALHPDVNLGPQFTPDNSSDNISDQNAYFSELTALYWMWKNCHNKYKGLVHYRRHFASKSRRGAGILHHERQQWQHRQLSSTSASGPSPDRFSRIVGRQEVSRLLDTTDIILPKKRHYYIETIRSHYSHTMYVEQLDETRAILVEKYPTFVPAFDQVMNARNAHLFNMFIMRADKFDEYCAFLFPILFELESRLDPAQYDGFHARYVGRVSERLLDVWLKTHRYSYAELPVMSPEPVNWWKKGTAFLTAKFTGKKYGSSF